MSSHLKTTFVKLILLATMGIIGWLPNHAVAHEDSEIESQFKKLSKEEEADLRDILAAPLNTGALKTTLENQIMRKRMAAKRLSDFKEEEKLLLEALTYVKEPGMYLDLSLIYVSRGEYAKAVDAQQEAVKLANGAQKSFHLAHLANRFFAWGRNDQCRKTLDETRTLIDSLKDKNLSPPACVIP